MKTKNRKTRDVFGDTGWVENYYFSLNDAMIRPQDDAFFILVRVNQAKGKYNQRFPPLLCGLLGNKI